MQQRLEATSLVTTHTHTASARTAMAGAAKARRRVFVRAPGSAFLDADRDVMSLVIDQLFPDRGYGKAKLSTVCKTLYNRYAKDNCHNRAVWLYNLHTGIEMQGIRNWDSLRYQLGNGDHVWKYSEPEHRLWSELSERSAAERALDPHGFRHEPPCLGVDRLNVRLKNIKVESSTHRRTCRHPQYWKATEEERRYARMFQYTKRTDVATFDVALEPDALVRDWTETQAAHIRKASATENHRVSPGQSSSSRTMTTARLPWFDRLQTQPQTAQVVACYPSGDPALQVGDTEMGTVPGYDRKQVVYERRLLETFHLEVCMKGPGFVATAVGQLTIDASNAPFRTTQRVMERSAREVRAFLRLNDLRFARGMPLVFLVEPVSIGDLAESNPYSRDETGRMPKWHPLMAHYAPGRDTKLEDHLDLCNSAAVVRWIRKFLVSHGARHMTEGLEDLSDDEEDDVWPTAHRPGGRDRYWSKQWALARHRPNHSIKAPATVRWTSVSYDCMPPRQLASVRVHEPYVAELLDAHVAPSSDGRVRLQLVPRVRKLDDESSSDEEDLLPRERRRADGRDHPRSVSLEGGRAARACARARVCECVL